MGCVCGGRGQPAPKKQKLKKQVVLDDSDEDESDVPIDSHGEESEDGSESGGESETDERAGPGGAAKTTVELPAFLKQNYALVCMKLLRMDAVHQARERKEGWSEAADVIVQYHTYENSFEMLVQTLPLLEAVDKVAIKAREGMGSGLKKNDLLSYIFEQKLQGEESNKSVRSLPVEELQRMVAEGSVKNKTVLITNKRWREKRLKREEVFVS
ncbi:hypothetical protein KFL_014960010 [Klebsormidium nitens]|uniref:Uncharacterized protein n=1 Tax=Klebsormidium nitens TaxID=105231 RepID=A0A1Y1IR55_KLENI|nr:hypothetical protein KFL_014960010 [Klebsormidium nitens]|eukprot:GAQ93395.1 hypothetical protein KFL_014960010 [Klebsormidium nitens]